MADYRRFISYMYLYENGRKTVNSGFVRVESRNGQCRLHVHMTGLYGPEGEANSVYMLIRDADSYIGIAVGSLSTGQQTGELDLVTDSSYLAGTDYGLDRVSGMVVLGDSGKIYGTRWDDEPLETDCFVSMKQLSENVMRFPAGMREPEREEKLERQKKQEVDGEKIPGNMAARSPVEIETEESDSSEKKNDVEMAVDTRGVTNDVEDKAEEIAEVDTEEVDASENKFDIAMESEKERHEITDENRTENIIQIMDEKNTVQEMNSGQQDVYGALMGKFPQMYPFDDNRIEVCVRLDLQDIGMLPMQCWLYGSNSFLLHGYYCYRHLILAGMHVRTGDEKAEKMVYMLGVPGVRQHREQYMASMFGFRHFKPVSSENSGSGAFGYWLVQLK